MLFQTSSKTPATDDKTYVVVIYSDIKGNLTTAEIGGETVKSMDSADEKIASARDALVEKGDKKAVYTLDEKKVSFRALTDNFITAYENRRKAMIEAIKTGEPIAAELDTKLEEAKGKIRKTNIGGVGEKLTALENALDNKSNIIINIVEPCILSTNSNKKDAASENVEKEKTRKERGITRVEFQAPEGKYSEFAGTRPITPGTVLSSTEIKELGFTKSKERIQENKQLAKSGA